MKIIKLHVRSKDLFGQRFGRLVAMYPTRGNPTKAAPNGHVKWVCSCSCGDIAVTSTYNLTAGHTKSCGCLQKERTSASNMIPVKFSIDENQCWRSINHRASVTGYSQRHMRGRVIREHVIQYMLLHEITEIPAGHEVHHMCRNKWCCNPEHLEMLPVDEHRRLHLMKPVNQIDIKSGTILRTWESAADASREGGFSASSISMCCHGTIKTHAGYRWEHVN